MSFVFSFPKLTEKRCKKRNVNIFPLYVFSFQANSTMRAVRGINAGTARGGGGGHANGYSSSEDDERARLKPQLKSGAPTKPVGSRQHYSGGGATSPNESDNTYAEAVLLTGSNTGRYEQEYDSDLYANGDPLSMGSPTNDIRYVGGGGHHPRISPQEENSSSSRSGGGGGNNRYASIAAARHAQVCTYLCN